MKNIKVTKLDNDMCTELINTCRPYTVKLVEEDHVFIGQIMSAWSTGLEVPEEVIMSIRNRHKILTATENKLHEEEKINGRKD